MAGRLGSYLVLAAEAGFHSVLVVRRREICQSRYGALRGLGARSGAGASPRGRRGVGTGAARHAHVSVKELVEISRQVLSRGIAEILYRRICCHK